MLFGANIPHTGALSSPQAIRDVAQAAEELGFDSVWTVDHVALMPHTESLYDLGREPAKIVEDNLKRTLTPLYECFTTMSYLAGCTTRVRIGCGVMVLPLRNPLYNARQLASLDSLSGGRLILGIGVGWLREEAEALQMPWDHRGARSDEHIALMRKFWTTHEPYVSFDGDYYQFEDIDPAPHPVQQPIPILVGGHSELAKKRAGRIGDGWITTGLPPEVQAEGMRAVRSAAEEAGRDPQSLLWYASLAVGGQSPESGSSLRKRLSAFADAGVHHIQLSTGGRSVQEKIDQMKWLAEEIIPEFSGK